jgi:hypothetical protein
VVEVAGVVAELLHVRRDLLGQPVVLLQIDDEVRVRPGGAISASAATSFGLSTAMRMTSAPASSSSSTWRMVAAMSCVRVAVIDWTAMGLPAPMRTFPMRISRVVLGFTVSLTV